MHIAAVMAALRVDDLDHMAKAALVVVCCRADRRTAVVVVSAGRVAADLGVHRNTARPALDRLLKSGYLAVDKRPGKASRWTVDLHNLGIPPAQELCATPAQSVVQQEESLEETIKEAGAHTPNGKVNGQPAPRFTADLPPNPLVIDDSGFAVRR